jgi:hypothetical protein
MNHTTHTTILASTFPNWYFMLHTFPGTQRARSLDREVFYIPDQWDVFLVILQNELSRGSIATKEILGGRYGNVIEKFVDC